MSHRDALKVFRERIGHVTKELREYSKETRRIKKKISEVLKDGPKTVPNISELTNLPSRTVLWHLMSMRKYGKIAEAVKDGDYYSYELIKEE